MPIAQHIASSDTDWRAQEQISRLLSDLHLRLDEAWLTGDDKGRLQHDITIIEHAHATLLCPCHLCAKPTIFLDAAYELPFCWACLQDPYHHWYRSIRYNRT